MDVVSTSSTMARARTRWATWWRTGSDTVAGHRRARSGDIGSGWSFRGGRKWSKEGVSGSYRRGGWGGARGWIGMRGASGIAGGQWRCGRDCRRAHEREDKGEADRLARCIKIQFKFQN
jgi:hypothetical protein